MTLLARILLMEIVLYQKTIWFESMLGRYSNYHQTLYLIGYMHIFEWSWEFERLAKCLDYLWYVSLDHVWHLEIFVDPKP